MLHTATYAASPCHLTPPRPATPPYPPPHHEDPIISTMTIVTMNPVEREHKFKIHACRHFMNTLYSINKGNSACVTNWGEAGLGWRPARPTTAYQGFSNNRHNPVMVYNDLMIRYILVHNYNKDRSQPVTIQCINTWVGVPVDRRRLTGMINRTLISVRIIVPFFCMASSPLSTSHQLILVIYIV